MFGILSWISPITSTLSFLGDHYILIGVCLIALILIVGLISLIEGGNPLQKIITGFMTGGTSILAPLATKIGIVVIVLLIGLAGFFYYKETVASYQVQMTQLQADKSKLEDSNKSLSATIEELKRVNQQTQDELKTAQESDQAAQQQISDFQKKLQSPARTKKLNTVKESPSSQLLLDSINKDVDCQVKNFGRKDGTCKDGVFQ